MVTENREKLSRHLQLGSPVKGWFTTRASTHEFHKSVPHIENFNKMFSVSFLNMNGNPSITKHLMNSTNMVKKVQTKVKGFWREHRKCKEKKTSKTVIHYYHQGDKREIYKTKIRCDGK